MWEAILRNLVIDGSQPQHVDPGLLQGRSIVKLVLNTEQPILDLRSPHFRHLCSDAKQLSEWQRLAVASEDCYGQTHAAAKELLLAAPRATGLCWPSRLECAWKL